MICVLMNLMERLWRENLNNISLKKGIKEENVLIWIRPTKPIELNQIAEGPPLPPKLKRRIKFARK